MPTPSIFEGINPRGTQTLIPCKDAKAQNGVIANTKLIKDTVGWSGKNKCPNTATAGTYNGIVRNANTDGSLTFSGTASANEWIGISNANLSKFELKLKAGVTYIMSSGVALPSGCVMHLRGEGDVYLANIQGTATEVSYTPSADINCHIGVRINNGTIISNAVTIYPMLRDADILDSTYEPYFGSTAFPRSEQAVLGAKNWLETSLARIKAINTGGTWNDNVYTFRDTTFTVNSDLSITVNNSSSPSAPPYFFLQSYPANEHTPFDGKNLILSGCPEGGDSSKYRLRYDKYDGTNNAFDYGDGVSVTPVTSNVTREVYIQVYAQVTNKVFKPMIRLASDPDDTYVPYVMTNKELTENKRDKALTVVTGVSVDTLLDNTRYFCNGNMTGLPTGNYGYLDVWNFNNTAYLQVFYPAGTVGKIYTRRKWDNVWSSWYEFTGTEVS